MKILKIVSVVLLAGLVCACYPRRFVYQQGPASYSVLADSSTAQGSIKGALYKAREVCTWNHQGVPHMIRVTTTPASMDKVKVQNHYLYVIQDTPTTNYFTVAEFNCVIAKQ